MTASDSGTVLAVALNPAIDMSSETETVHPTRKIRTSGERYDPGGGGINVARVAAELGGRPEALFLAGGATGALLEDLLDGAGIACHPVPIAGSTRISFTVHERATDLEYRFVPEGPTVTPAEIEPCLDVLRAGRHGYVAASGSMPRGAPADTLARMARIVAARGGRFVLDTSGEALRATLEHARVFLVKPSRGELEALVGHELDERGIREAATDLVRRGAAEFVAVSLGAEGALLADGRHVLRMPALHVPVRSAVGAGDSFVGAMVFALAEGKSPEDAFCLGMAAGAAAVLTPGTELCRRADVLRLHEELCSTCPRHRIGMEV
ncbi:1-phosphofructokinase family hexose kinase [Kaustia mangrovi]|uniref:Phosphofructokinase n=1 Tax=Kaustia mangrovi TaxID=2593653 RepID=A0A7S8HB92_9HYPH|nr:1-phosphofructokinase family hexose kinase [Kaustia mangrovi]QPC41938.1 1-phosphofructokinase family hexose kinase [Kaustia mangrovi]